MSGFSGYTSHPPSTQQIGSQSGSFVELIGGINRFNESYPVKIDLANGIEVSPSSYGATAFNEFRVALPNPKCEIVNYYEIDTNEYDLTSSIGGTITYLSESMMIALRTNASSGSLAMMRTNTYHHYHAGKGQRIRLTCAHQDTGIVGQQRDWGYHDESDGLFYRADGQSLNVVRRTSTSGVAIENIVSQSAWNCDKLDGTGKSNVALDITKGNIYEITFQWLGVGTVCYFINGILVHKLDNPNLYTTPYMRSGKLPVSYEVRNTTATITGSGFNQICTNVNSEGSNSEHAYSYAAGTTNDITASTSFVPILSIRPKSLYANRPNRTMVLPTTSTVTTDGKRAQFKIVMNSTLTNSSFVSVNNHSVVEYDVTATSGSGGETLYVGNLPLTTDGREIDISHLFGLFSRRLQRKAFSTNVDVLTLYGRSATVGTTTMGGTFAWEELK